MNKILFPTSDPPKNVSQNQHPGRQNDNATIALHYFRSRIFEWGPPRITLACNEPNPSLPIPDGPPRLDVILLSAEHLFSKQEVQNATGPLEAYIALKLPQVSAGWYHQSTRFGFILIKV